MKNYLVKFLILTLGLTSFACNKKVNEYAIKNRNDLLFLAESTNTKNLDLKIVRQYLDRNKKSNPKSIFKEFDTLRKNSKYSIFLILENDTTQTKRDYKFSILTIDKENLLIDHYLLAQLDDNKELECYGKINEYLTIEKKCGDSVEQKEIDTAGYIRNYSSW